MRTPTTRSCARLWGRAAAVPLLAAASAACGSGRAPSAVIDEVGVDDASATLGADAGVDGARPPSEDGGAVMGTVVDLTTDRPLVGRSVFVQGRSSVTDSAGRFTVPEAGRVYDAVVADADGSIITAYLGLSRRDPVLGHRTSGVTDLSETTAVVTGSLSGDEDFPLGPSDSVGVYVFSAQADGRSLLAGSGPAAMPGPTYGPMVLAWEGAAPFAGQLVSLGSFGSADAGFTWAYASQPLSVSAGQSVTANVALAAVPARTLSGSVRAPPGYRVLEKQVYYHFPVVHSVLPVTLDVSTPADFAYSIPDLGGSGPALCVAAVGSPGTLITQECGVSATAQASITLQAPPAFSAPLGSPLSAASSLAWSAFDGGVHLLRFESSPPTQQTPDVDVFTASPGLALPDLQAMGVPFPVGFDYVVTLVGVGPFTSMDDAFGPAGIGAPLPAEQRWSYAPGIGVRLGP